MSTDHPEVAAAVDRGHSPLTLAKVRVYQNFAGDIDGWARASGGGDPSGMTDNDWFLIGELRQGLSLVSAGAASPEFGAAVERRLTASTADEPTRPALRQLAMRPR